MRVGEELEMKLSDLRAEIEESSKSPYGEKLYPITSDWIPVTDVFAIIDRFERELRQRYGSVPTIAKSQSNNEVEEYLRGLVADLLS